MPLSVEELGEERFNAEIEKGMADLNSGKVVPAEYIGTDLQDGDGTLDE